MALQLERRPLRQRRPPAQQVGMLLTRLDLDDALSIVDITAAVAVDFARIVKVKPGEQHPHLVRWRAAMALRRAMAL